MDIFDGLHDLTSCEFLLVRLHKIYCLQNSADVYRRHEKSNN